MTTATRIYVGGLGERVTDEDLRKTFSNLGSIESVDIIRTKGRSFAYINFIPTSDNSLAKLFSMYNGCLWKGGKLKLEKAKEHYIDRLKREWVEDAELSNTEHINHVDDENMPALANPKSSTDTEQMQIRIFFPKLRKVKSLSLRGTGKHKYSFQRVNAPSRPVHFCDCPEHSNLVETHKETKDQKLIMNRLSDGETYSRSKHLQLSHETQVQDSIIQDAGMNDEEINVMTSVMKKLLDKGSSRTERSNVEDASHKNIPSDDVPVDTNEINDESDDDDIKINTVAGQNSGSFSESLELQTSLLKRMARSNNDLATQNKPGIRNKKEKPSNKKRKSRGESSENDWASPVSKKSCLQTLSNESEEHTAILKVVTEAETNKSSIQNGVLSQKSAWRELVSDGVSSSFSLSQVTPSGDWDGEEQPERGSETSDSEEHVGINNVVQEDLDGQPSQPSKEHTENLKVVTEPETQKSSIQNGVLSQKSALREVVSDGVSGSFSLSQITPTGDSDSEEQPEPGSETSSDTEERVGINNVVQENLDGQPSQPTKKEGVLAAQPAVAKTDSDTSTKGSSWQQKCSWTQLVSGGNNSSFSISQILPANVIKKQDLQKPTAFSITSSFTGGSTVKEQRTNETAGGFTQGSKSGFAASNKKRDAEVSAPKGVGLSKAPSDDFTNATFKEKPALELKESSSSSFPGVAVGVGGCSFMRSADSLKDWMTAKTALSNALKKRNNNKKSL